MWRSGTGAPATLFYEDLTVDKQFDLKYTTVDSSQMREFARRFDPQWYHVDDALSADGPFEAVTASGWFTASLFMRMYVDQVLTYAAADASPGVETMRWLAPVYGGDQLHGTLVVMEREPSRSRPGRGTVTWEGTLRHAARGDVFWIRFRGWFGMRTGLSCAEPPSRQQNRLVFTRCRLRLSATRRLPAETISLNRAGRS